MYQLSNTTKTKIKKNKMKSEENSTLIIEGTNFDSNTDYIYTKPKINASGGKSIGIINCKSKKGLYISTPLMLTWGVNCFTDDKLGTTTYDMSLQFPKEEYNNESVEKFLENMKAFEQKIKEDAIINSKEWMNKTKMSSEVIDALWTPMLKYPKDKASGDFDYERPPTLRIKMSVWEGEWKCELYDLESNMIFPNDNNLFPTDLISKGTNVATVIQCGGLWFANGKFGVTWRFIQAIVKPRESITGKCLINLTQKEKEEIKKTSVSDEEDNCVKIVDSSDDEEVEEEEEKTEKTVKEEIAEEVAKVVESSSSLPDKGKKKVVRKKKGVEE